MSVANAVQKLFSNYCKREAKIKWPNDIYWCDRKAGGILIENVIQGKEWKWAVIGIGLNINQVDFGSYTKAISLRQITGKENDTIVMAKELVQHVHSTLKQLISDSKKVIKYYHRHLYKLKEKVQLKVKDKSFEAIIKGVSEDGMLVVHHHEKDEQYRAGEIEWMNS
jgi:BirA family biotin operon repressor/biotin-[acetyl-CoA-carboxylase] ligase